MQLNTWIIIHVFIASCSLLAVIAVDPTEPSPTDQPSNITGNGTYEDTTAGGPKLSTRQGVNKIILAGSADFCPPGSYIYFIFFLVAASLAGLLTIAFLALVIIVFIARNKMVAQGMPLPKKPWEPEAEEDNKTFVEQTVGVEEQTTIGGGESAYTTLAQ